MKKTIAKKWVEALRSGKYKQGQEFLHRVGANGEETYCCLGVLCDLYQQDRRSKKKKALAVRNLGGIFNYNNTDSHLPDEVCQWAGIQFVDGNWDKYDKHATLVNMNDELRKSFKTIANFIEKNVEKL